MRTINTLKSPIVRKNDHRWDEALARRERRHEREMTIMRLLVAALAVAVAYFATH